MVILVFAINVRVKAVSISSPHNCHLTAGSGQGVYNPPRPQLSGPYSPCAFYTENNIEHLKTPSANLSLVRGASVVSDPLNKIKLIRGLVHVKANAATTLSTLYGELKWSDGEILVEAVDSLVKFTNLSSSDFRYHPRGEISDHELPIGFSTYFSKITQSGVAETGYPHPAEIESLIKSWSKVYSRTEKSRFTKDIKDFMVFWHAATQLVGPWYLDTIKREIAAEEAETARKARLKAMRDAENNMLREMFRKRVFEP